MCISVILEFVANYGNYCCHGVVDSFDAGVTTRGVGTEGKGLHSSRFGVRCKPWLILLPWCGRYIRRHRYHSGSRRLS